MKAIDRLNERQTAGLRNVAASFQMENMELSTEELEILASYVLDEISAEECDRRMDALGRSVG